MAWERGGAEEGRPTREPPRAESERAKEKRARLERKTRTFRFLSRGAKFRVPFVVRARCSGRKLFHFASSNPKDPKTLYPYTTPRALDINLGRWKGIEGGQGPTPEARSPDAWRVVESSSLSVRE